MWSIFGWNLKKRTLLMDMLMFSEFWALFGIPFLGFLVLILDEVNLSSLADTFESCGPHYQLLVKILLTRVSIDNIYKVLEQMQLKFWSLNKFNIDIERKVNNTYLLFKNFYRIYSFTLILCGIFVCVRPLLLNEKKFPLAVHNFYDVENHFYYTIIYIWQLFNFIVGIGTLLAIDGLFVLFVVNIVCQAELLKYGFASLQLDNVNSKEEEDICHAKIKEYIHQHNILLRIIKDLTNIYSMQIFNQFIANTASICMGVYIATVAGMSDPSTVFRAFFITTTFFLQLCIYCAGGTFITEAYLALTDPFFYCGWEGPYNKKLRYAIKMMIMRAQKPEILKAGKIFDVNLGGISGVLKTSVSVYTLMNNINNLPDQTF